MKYVEIKDGMVVSGPWDYDGDLPNFSDIGITTTDVTNETDMPTDRWTYDGTSFTAPPAPAPLTYDENRQRAYDPFADQLDALFRDIDNGTLDSTGEFYTHIKTVKDTYPKP